jgi:hypothetical protein
VAKRVAHADAALDQLLGPLIAHEIAAIAAIDTAVAAEQHPDYVVMYYGLKTGKQANVEQMVTLIRRGGGVPPERAGVLKFVMQAQSAIAGRISGTTAAVEILRMNALSILKMYAETIRSVDDAPKLGLRRALGRTLVGCHLLTAHVAKRTGSHREAAALPEPLAHYFAGAVAKACMRCHLDRPGDLDPLERSDPHPYTYVCAACHGEVRAEFPPDIASQMERWPAHAQESRVLQHAMSRPSMLNAIHQVLYPLAGLPAERPIRAVERAQSMPPAAPPPAPAPDEPPTVVVATPHGSAEAGYVTELFDYRSARAFW